MSLFFKSGARSGAVENRAGVLLYELAAEAGFPINMPCGGSGTCRRCMVLLGAGAYRIAGKKVTVAAGETLEARACKTEVLCDDAVIHIPATSLFNAGRYVDSGFNCAVDFIPAENKTGFGVAVDIGTTTVAALLVELSTGKILAKQSQYNQQIELGDNVATRIALCADESNIKKLQQLVINETVAPLIDALVEQSKINSAGVAEIVFSGNTVMSHLALGLSALSIGVIPFEPLTKIFRDCTASEIGLTCVPNAVVKTVPAISGYVGGDIVSDLFVAGLSKQKLELLVDIGTNGELVLNDHGKLYATATAAGPAFEGAGLLHGGRADTGMIEKIICTAGDVIEYKTIDDAAPRGLCGSAVIDFIATAFKTGLLNPMGRFDCDRLRAAGKYVDLDCHGINVIACVIASPESSATGEAVLITEYDVSQILKAKAAIYAGIRTLLGECGYAPENIDRLILAGGFAAHLDLGNAITLGMLPEIPLEQYDVIGNGSLAGAYAALGAPGIWSTFKEISCGPKAFHLAETDEFDNRFVDALAIPNLDPAEFSFTL